MEFYGIKGEIQVVHVGQQNGMEQHQEANSSHAFRGKHHYVPEDWCFPTGTCAIMRMLWL